MLKRLFAVAGVLMVVGGLGMRVAGAQATDPASVAAALISNENAHNVAGAVGMFASDAVVTLPTGTFKTTAEIQNWQSELAAGNFHATTDPPTVNGNAVHFTGNVALDTFRKAGFDHLNSIWDITVESGKIKTFTFNFTPEDGAKLQKALALANTGSGLRDHLWLLSAGVGFLVFGVVLAVGARPRRVTVDA